MPTESARLLPPGKLTFSGNTRIPLMQKSAIPFSLRLATSADIPALHTLIESSVRGLQKNDYTLEQIDGALGTVLGLDTQLVADKTYFVAEAKAACARTIVGCGGWSNRKTLFGSDHAPVREPEFLDPATDAICFQNPTSREEINASLRAFHRRK